MPERVKGSKRVLLKKADPAGYDDGSAVGTVISGLLGICFTMDMEAIYRPLWDFDDMNGLLDYICSMACCAKRRTGP